MSPGWRDALRFARALLGSLLLVVASAGCGAINRYPDVEPEDSAAACSDGVDNDLDGRQDCRDAGCAAFCRESSADRCADHADNDVDGLVDCDDSDCAEFCREADVEACSDRIDNDRDGVKDCLDPECAELAVCGESDAESCADGRDNDADELVDCRDPSCAPFCAESSATACSDGLDNDFSGLLDCEDSSCDGFCPEDDPSTCSDSRDDDGDGFTDAEDPSCWPFTPPRVERCATLEGAQFFDSFDAASQAWYEFGGLVALGMGTRNGALTGRSDPVASFSSTIDGSRELAGNLPGFASNALFAGDITGLTLRFSASVLNGGKLVVALTPDALAPLGEFPHHGAEDALLSVTIDRGSQPTFTLSVEGTRYSAPLAPVPVCGAVYCRDGWTNVTLRFQDGTVVAWIEDGLDVPFQTPEVASRVIPPSRLVVWGGSTSLDVSTRIDDLALEIADVRSCGIDAPQIPLASQACSESAPKSVGITTSLAQNAEGELCALLGASSSPTAVERAEHLSAWSSQDAGDTWQPREPAGEAAGPLPIPDGASLIGGSVVWDAEIERYRAAVAYAESEGVRVAFSSSSDCGAWEALEPGPLLPPDAEPPSYVLRGKRHELYFTRPPVGGVRRTLWRVSGSTEASMALEEAPLAELPAEANADVPASIERVGALDLVMTYRTIPSAGITGLGMMVGRADGSNWRVLPSIPLLGGTGSVASFDSGGIAAGSLHWAGDGGVLLYGGIRTGVRVGTARLAKACAEGAPCDAAPEEAAPVVAWCGDSTCDAWEDCQSCAEDCACPGSELLERPLSDHDGWQGLGEGIELHAYLDDSSEGLHTTGLESPLGANWVELPLDAAVTGDFELSFDVQAARKDCPVLEVGLGARADANAAPRGAFAEVWGRGGPCADWPPRALAISDTRQESPPPDSYCPAGEPSPPGTWAHVVLRREKGVVSVVRADDERCLEPVSVAYVGAMPPLSSLFVGYGLICDGLLSANAIQHVELRLLTDPTACPAGEKTCKLDGTAPVCVDLEATPEHCGGCGEPCMPGGECHDGACRCPEATSLCSKACVDKQSSKEHCGSCGHACDYACAEGKCITSDYSCERPYLVPVGSGEAVFSFADGESELSALCGARAAHRMIFSWTALISGPVRIALHPVESTEFIDTLLGVSGPACDSFELCNDDIVDEIGSALELDAVYGVTYSIAVAIFSNDEDVDTGGEIQLSVSPL